jgi:hypothetical protein
VKNWFQAFCFSQIQLVPRYVPGCKFTTRKREALAAHKLRHQQRQVERSWKAQAKGEAGLALFTT